MTKKIDKERGFSSTEWKLRVQLAAAYRLVDRFGFSETVYNHISARLPGTKHQFLLNPFGLLYSEITASNLVMVDSDGKLIGKGKINPAGFLIHSAIHEARPDAQCILHTHTPAGMAIASLAEGFRPFTQEALRFHGRVAYHRFEGIVLDRKEKSSLLRDLGDKPVLILRNHGLITIGQTVGQAFGLMYYLERACQTQLAALATGKEILHPSSDVAERTARQHWNKIHQLDEFLWPALLRGLDREALDYKT